MKYSDNYEFSLPSKADGDSADIDPISENFKQIDSILKNIYTKLASQIVFLAENEISLETSPEDIPYGINVCFVNKSSFVNGLVQIGTLIALKNENLDRHTYQVDEFWIGNTTLVPMQRKSVKTDEGEKVWQEWQRLATEDTVTAYINSFAESENIFKQHILEKLSEIDKRTVNLEQGITPSPFETDDTVAYSKIVPENALPYAEISKVGGMTRKRTNLIPYPYFDETKTINGITFVNNGDGSITINGTASNNADFFLFKNNNNVVKLTEGTTYVSNMPNGCRLMGYDAVQGAYPVLSTSGSSTTLSKAFSLNQVYIRVTSGTTMDNIRLYPMFNEGTTALPYEPYFEGLRSAPVTEVESKGVNGVISTFPIPESVQALDGYGWGVSESVYNYIDFDKKQFVKRVEKVEFDGTEKWNTFDKKQYGLLHSVLNTGNTSKCLSNKFIFRFSTNSGTFFCGVSGIAFNTDFETINEWKAFLAEQYSNGTPVTVYVELAESIITDISDILSDDNYIAVEGGGTVTMINEFEYAVPSEITYQIKGDA